MIWLLFELNLTKIAVFRFSNIFKPKRSTRQHPAGRVARSADSRSSYSVPLEPQSTVHKLFNIPPIYLDWTLSNQPPAKIEPRRHETQPSRRHETQPSRRPSSPTVTKLNPAAGHRAPPWPNSTQPDVGIHFKKLMATEHEMKWNEMKWNEMKLLTKLLLWRRMSCNGNFLYGSILSPSPSWHLSRNVQNKHRQV